MSSSPWPLNFKPYSVPIGIRASHVRREGGLVIRTSYPELETVSGQLDALLLKFTSPENTSGSLISNGEYQAFKTQLVGRKNTLESALVDTGKEMEQWLELSERTFNFACYARDWFENGDNTMKRSILACLGSNLVLKDQKINVQLHPFFLSILENKKTLMIEDVSARTSEDIDTKRQKGTFVPSRPIGLALVDDFRTIEWADEYAYPTLAIQELEQLLS